MAWLTAVPDEGSGEVQVNFTAGAHTGRGQRMVSVVLEATGVSDDVAEGTQEGALEFVEINDVSVGKEGGNVTVTGTTNSSNLTFSLGTNQIGVTLPASYSAGGATTANGAAISGDPGNDNAFSFSVTFAAAANETIEERKTEVKVTAAGGQSDSAYIEQAAGDPFAEFSEKTLTFSAAGGSKTVTVKSNTNWKIKI